MQIPNFRKPAIVDHDRSVVAVIDLQNILIIISYYSNIWIRWSMLAGIYLAVSLASLVF